MRNIPMFATEYGIGNLLLKNVPYSGRAYIQILSSENPLLFLRECYNFCCSAGAAAVYATGHPALKQFPLHTEILYMSGSRSMMPEAKALLQPMTEETMELWRELYNRRMQGVSAADYMTTKDTQRCLDDGNCYFVYADAELLGLGMASQDHVDAVVGLKPGAGVDVLSSLCGILEGDHVSLKVASTNSQALGLYRRLGFVLDYVAEQWYEVTKF